MTNGTDKFDKFIQEIIDKTDILTVIGSFTTLTKIAENTHVGTCPFHDGDKTHHFIINTKRKTWECYACRSGSGTPYRGNVIDFIMRKEGITLNCAIARMAGQIGLKIPDFLAPLWWHEAKKQNETSPENRLSGAVARAGIMEMGSMAFGTELC